MLQLLNLTHGNVIATKATQQLKPSDYEKLHPIIHNILEEGKKIRWYLEIAKLEDWSVEPRLQCINHADEFEKICLIGAMANDARITSFLQPFRKAEVRFFTAANINDAQDWINEK